jgi:3-ketosteroid 9alpha-monooxygenase subunit A
MTAKTRKSLHGGWYLLALGDELAEPVTGFMLGDLALAAVRDNGRLRVFDGTCPHRGAHLGHGGRLVDGRAIICPFHGKRIGLGDGPGGLRVREHEVLDCGGAVFVRLAGSPGDDHGFEVAMKELIATHQVASALIVPVSVPPEIVIENAFDIDHFPAVHLVPRLVGLKVEIGRDGELTIATGFVTKAPAWEAASGEVTSRFFARAFSPNLVVTDLGTTGGLARGDDPPAPPAVPARGDDPPAPPAGRNVVITGASPAGRGCVARIAIAVPRGSPEGVADALIAGARHAFEQDLRVWEHLNLDAQSRLGPRDTPVLAFRAFCASFATVRE